MANMLEKYRDITDEAATLFGEAADKAERHHAFSKKERKLLKRMEKTVRKQNELLKQIIEQREAERETAATSTDVCKKDEGGKGFLGDLRREICKAIPKLIVAVVTGVLGLIFKPKSSGKTPQTA